MDFLKLLYLILTVLGFFQGLLLSFGLTIKHQKQAFSRADYFLITLIIAIALENLRISILNSTLYLDYPLLVWGTSSVGLVFGPLLWFYQYFFLYPSKKFRSRDWLHFMPALVEIGFHVPLLIQLSLMNDAGEIASLMSSFQLGIGRMIIQYLSAISLLAYLIFSLKNYYAYLRDLEDSSSQPFSHRWLGQFLWFFTFLIICFISLTFVDIIFFQYQLPEEFYFLFNILLTIFIYWIGFSQWLFQHTIISDFSNELVSQAEDTHNDSVDFSKEIIVILNYMQSHKPYLDADLTLKKLAEQLEISPKKLTRVLNQGLKKNFFEFVNQYRIEEVKTKINENEDEHLTLLGIAFDAGFNSKSAFNRVFKLQTGITPKQYQQKIRKINQK